MITISSQDRTPDLIQNLLIVWEESVRATHLFLSSDEIEKIKEYVPRAIREIQHLVIIENAEKIPVAFMGIDGQRLEMLFIANGERGQGLGKKLLQHGIAAYSINEVTVNEQNPQTQGFYEHMGFKIYKRTDHDEQGNPYPLLYMNLPTKENQY